MTRFREVNVTNARLLEYTERRTDDFLHHTQLIIGRNRTIFEPTLQNLQLQYLSTTILALCRSQRQSFSHVARFSEVSASSAPKVSIAGRTYAAVRNTRSLRDWQLERGL